MDYERAKKVRDVLQSVVNAASAKLQAFPKGEMGMIREDVRFTRECMDAKASYASAMRGLQEFNSKFVKTFAKEIRAERRQKFSDKWQCDF